MSHFKYQPEQVFKKSVAQLQQMVFRFENSTLTDGSENLL
jgi:hypothetical protein